MSLIYPDLKIQKSNDLRWTEVSSLPYSFYGGSSLRDKDGWINILGTMMRSIEDDGPNPTNHYIFKNNTWERCSVLPYDFYEGCAILDNNSRINIIGSHEHPNNHYVFDGTSWTSVSWIPYKFYNGSAVLDSNGIINIFGGGADATSGTYHYKYNNNGSWTMVSQIPYRFECGSSLLDSSNNINLLGGIYSKNNHYKFVNSAWTSVSTIPYDFINGAALLDTNGFIQIFGSRSYPYKNYTYKSNSWVDNTLNNKNSALPFKCQDSTALIDNCGNITIVDGNESTEDAGIPRRIYSFIKDDVLTEYFKNNMHLIECSPADYPPFNQNTEIKLIDGWNTISTHNSLTVTNTNKATFEVKDGIMDWSYINSIPHVIDSGSVVVTPDGVINLLGGTDESNTSKFYRYENGNWVAQPDLPFSMAGARALLNRNSQITVVGVGGTGTYFYRNNTWNTTSSIPIAFKNIAAVLDKDGFVNVFGGNDVNSYNHHYRLNPTTNQWTEVSELPFSFKNNCVVLDKKGCINIFDSNSNHYIYNGIKWALCSETPFDFYYGTALLDKDGYINLIGGDDSHNVHLKFDGTDWLLVSKIPTICGKNAFLDKENNICFIESTNAENNGFYKFSEHCDILGYFKKGMKVNNAVIAKDGWNTIRAKKPVLIKS